MAAGELRRQLGIPRSSPVVGTVARLDVQKRLDRLLEAVSRLGADVHCIVAGAGPERAGLETVMASLGLAGRVHFLGNREDVGDVYAELDVMVVSSDREGLSNSMLEAMASGVPVVSTPVSGAEDALESFGDGRKPGVKVGFDAGEIAAALELLLGDPDIRAEMGRAAQERAQTRFSVDGMLDRWEAVLHLESR
jgi:glycosyltransferase involved in cell wall biosynthesis